MIAYDLQCANGHQFEGWFEDADAYQVQKKKELISCPVCNSTSVARALSTFAIKKSTPTTPSRTDDQVKLNQMAKQVVDYVEKNFDDVGADFTKEALKMHYGVNEPRNIRGFSTKEEEKVLKEEGVQFFKFPLPPPPDTDS
jgi:hypothetical protein